MEFLPYGQDGVRILFGTTIDIKIHSQVRQYYFFLRSLALKGIREIIPSFCSVLLLFDPAATSFDAMVATVKEREGDLEAIVLPEPSRVTVPVRYGGAFGPDMGFVCSYSGLTEREVVEIHTSRVYTVFAVGFMPGFPYLGELDKRLYVPRLETPRLKVAEGSVGLAQLQTGIYTFESPGGWRIIGRTDLALFNPKEPPFSILTIGDTVKFEAQW